MMSANTSRSITCAKTPVHPWIITLLGGIIIACLVWSMSSGYNHTSLPTYARSFDTFKAFPKAHMIVNAANELGRASMLWTTESLSNAQVIVLPLKNGTMKYLMVANGLHGTAKTHLGDETILLRIAACFVKPLDLRGGRSEFRCEGSMFPLPLSFPAFAPLPICGQLRSHCPCAFGSLIPSPDPKVWVLNVHIGSTDARLWLNDDGIPLMVMHTSHSTFCRGMGIIDVRAAIPELQEAYGDSGLDHPLLYSDTEYLIRDDQRDFEVGELASNISEAV